MSGHSKFANIKHKKEKNDAAKGKIFTIIGREIAVAVKEGGPDPANNYKLATFIAKAKANNMPNDTIDRGIKKDLTVSQLSLNALQITRTEQQVMFVPHLPKDREISEHRAVYHTCLTNAVRLSSTRKNAIWTLTTL